MYNPRIEYRRGGRDKERNMEKTDGKKLMNVSKKSFVSALIILLCLMIAAYALTFILPAGEYERVIEDVREKIVPDTYTSTQGGIPFWKWILSPFLVLGSQGGGTVIAICALLVVIGGSFTALDESGAMYYMLCRIQHRFKNRRFALLAIVSLFFMMLGAMVGSFEEVVPLVPIAVALAYCMGWDALIGLGMSIFATSLGFSSGVCNVFSVGVAQGLAGLPMMSGLSFRILTFVIIYPLLYWFLSSYAKKIEKDPSRSLLSDKSPKGGRELIRFEFTPNKRMDKAVLAFAIVLGTGIMMIILSMFVKFLQDYLMAIIAVMFLVAGVSSVLISGMSFSKMAKAFGKGVLSFLPALLMILMASSVRYIMQESSILDTILYFFASKAANAPKYVVVLLIYLLVMVMNFFIGSASAKAFLLMPIIAPLAEMCGVNTQVAILAFAFGDGFSNIFYPTNAVLLISLGLANVSYGKWARWSLRLLLPIFIITILLLLLANAVGYNLI